MSNYICPHCGNSDYYELYSTVTALAWTPHYVNGQLVNDNPNQSTTVCRCGVCGKEFSARNKYDETESHPL